MVLEDAIISRYVSENGDYSGSESIINIDDVAYKARGFSFQGDKKLSSWSVVMTKS
ncbi:hypothetical protein [Aneurinibacillus aneurinilyticus]|uniref:Uncharacterized protein n=1 Tax=Aneurinibacillus aneurinilyticus TaxID=1391 RepID=A0A848D1C0_ANEAE|nr:hypothetical protein [Aneurinibacillus aneurinilyticus]NMF01239.1 hypothetical protein [Aneurinibacillus aneurinilyticus]